MTLGEAAIIAILSSLPATLAPARRCDQSPILAIWRKHAVEAGEVDPWLRHQGCQPRNEVQRLGGIYSLTQRGNLYRLAKSGEG